MFGLNSTCDIKRATRTVTESGAVSETLTTVYTGVRCTLQAHILNNLPPPNVRMRPSGEQYTEEFRAWLRIVDVPDVRVNDYFVDKTTDFTYRITAVIDDAGRRHHWLLRMEKYNDR